MSRAALAVKRFSIRAAVGISVVVAFYDGWLRSRALAPDADLFSLHQFILAVALAT